MAGGYGTRFWPQSRRAVPKQFLPLGGGSETLIQATVRRVAMLAGPGGVLVVSGEDHFPLLNQQLPEVASLLEPVGRNTAPCVGFAALRVLQEVGDVPMICLPADHFIRGDEEFVKILARGVEIAREDPVLVTVGIKPTAPETGYGYICSGTEVISPEAGKRAYSRVERFVEKPNRETALEYLQSGRYLWNAGIFVWRPSIILSAIKEFLPDLHVHLQAIGASFGHPDEREQIAASFGLIKSTSVDVGVMERAENSVVLVGDTFSWSDIGSWSAWVESVRESGVTDAQANILRGDGVLVGCSETTVVSTEQGRFIAGVGLDNLIIVDTKDALLVVAKESSQDVKKVVDYLESQKRSALY